MHASQSVAQPVCPNHFLLVLPCCLQTSNELVRVVDFLPVRARVRSGTLVVEGRSWAGHMGQSAPISSPHRAGACTASPRCLVASPGHTHGCAPTHATPGVPRSCLPPCRSTLPIYGT